MMDNNIIDLTRYIRGMREMGKEDINFTKKAKEILNLAQENTIPIDTINIATFNNIDVYETEFDDENISGVIFKKDNKTTILVNQEDSYNRQRFTIAHELAHFFLHMDKKNVYEEYYRNSNGRQIEEIEANSLAAEILMPKNEVIAEFNKIMNVKCDKEVIMELSQIFRVSEQAMQYRLINLGLIVG